MLYANRFSGICTAIKLKTELDISTFMIFDENEDFGGTWLVNKYPGCACDIPSHLYSFSFELNPSELA
jgi:cation diffusion facilitator CzcD-associated flavoprotein CzcO